MVLVEKLSIPTLANKIQTEGDAYVFMERMRWGDDNAGLRCPHCGIEKAYFLNPANGVNRKTRTGSASQRRVWKCASCRKQFSVLTGTIFHGSKVPLRTWLFVVFAMVSSKNGMSAREIERTYGLTPKTAWFVLHRIREAMKREPLVGMLRGTVVADETFIGGKPKNKHQQGRPRPYGPGGTGRAGQRPAPKTAVLSLIEVATGEVRSTVVPDVTGASLRKVMSEHIDFPATNLMTDSAMPYRQIGQEMESHRYVDHSANEYVRYEGDEVITSNHAEGYFSQLKRSLDGTHHHVSTKHLPRYLAEFDYRYSTRKMTDTERTHDLFGKVDGKRLTYRPMTGGE
jgi:transposase-like protein